MQDIGNSKLQKKATEATALAVVESSNHREIKEYIKSTLYQMKEMIEKLPEVISQSKDLIVMLTQVEDFLNEIPEAECVSSLPPKFESMYRKKTNIFPLDNSSSNLQKYKLEENNVVEVDRSQDGVSFVEKNNVSKLQSKLQNTIDVHALDTRNSKLHEHGLEENVGSSQVDPFQDEENLLEESNGSKLKFGEGNLPAETNISKRHNAPHMLPSSINTPNFSKSRLEENNDSLEAGHSKAGGSNVGAMMPPQDLENGSRSLDASRTPSQNLEKCSISLGYSKLGRQVYPKKIGRQGSSILEKFESGVYAFLTLQPDGIKVLKQIKFR
ncbi:hypothetical protein RJT34_01202 [Clitoria ternatea]|uniref:BRX domain-containing protein n=1 Tax=Clitoria ternatea TaxID=43366 RepID=A0AAN9KHY3_CLITE